MKFRECAICGENSAKEIQRLVEFEYNNTTLRFNEKTWLCECCEGEFADAAQSKHNKRAVIAAKAVAEGAPSCVALRKWRFKWGFTQAQAGLLLGVGPVAFSKYENDDLLPSAPTLRLLYLVTRSDEAVRLLADRMGIELRKEQNEEPKVVVTEKSSDSSHRDWLDTSPANVHVSCQYGGVDVWFRDERNLRNADETSLETISF